MARHLKTYERTAGGHSSYEGRQAIFDRWWQASENNVDQSIGHFGFQAKWQQAYNSVQYAADESPLEYAWRFAQTQPLPPGTLPPGLISDRIQEKDKVRLLAAVCYFLQTLRPDAPFFLGCRDAGKLLDVTHTTINLWLSSFYNPANPDRILDLIKKGSRASKSTSEYRFLYPPPPKSSPA